MKKILALLILLTLVVSVFAACKKDETPADDNTPSDTPVVEQAPTAEDAKVVLRDIYKDKEGSLTPGDFDIVNGVVIDETRFAINWTTDTDKVVITESTKDGMVTVDLVDEEPIEAFSYTITATITDAKGNTATASFSFNVPKFVFNTCAEYYAAKAGDYVVVTGIITGMMSKDNGNDDKNCLFLQDLNNEGGYYVFGLVDDPTVSFKIGQTVIVKGTKDIYSGTHEIKDATVKLADSTIKTVTPIDFTDIFKNATDTASTTLTGMQGMLVTIKGVTVGTAGSNGYYNWSLDGKTSYVRISSSANATTHAQEAIIIEKFNANFNNKADVTGIVTIYQNKFYLQPIDENAFSNFVQQEAADDVKVNHELGQIALNSVISKDGAVTVPVAGSLYTNVVLSWASDNACAVVDNAAGTITFTRPTSAVTVKLTVTATLGEVTVSKEFTVTVEGSVFDGTVNLTSTNMGLGNYAAGEVTVEGVKFGYTELGDYGNGIQWRNKNGNIGSLWNETELPYGIKKIVIVYNASNDAPAEKLLTIVFGDNAYTVDLTGVSGQKTYEIVPDKATYTSFKMTHACSKSLYIDEINIVLDKPVEEHTCEFSTATCTQKATCSICGATQGETLPHEYNDETHACTCGKEDPNYYWEMTIEEALQAPKGKQVKITGVVVEIRDAWDTGYKNMSVYIAATADSETKILIYRTSEELKVGDSVIVTGVIGQYNNVNQIAQGSKVEKPCNHQWTAATCETPKTCSACNETEGEALGHNYVDGACDREGCGKLDPSIHICEFVATETVVAPTCTADGYTVYECTGADCNETEHRDPQPALGHEDTNSDYKCDRNCGANVLPAADSTITLTQAQQIAALFGHNTYTTDKYYVVVTIKEVYNTQYGNFYVTDGVVDSFTVYGTYSADGKTGYNAMETKPVAGDTVTLYGIIGTYSNAAQMKNAWITAVESHECVPGDAATCTTAQTCTICSKVIVAALGHDFQGATCTTPGVCSVCQTEGKTIDHIFENGVCTGCGTSEGNAPVTKTEMSVSKSHTDIASIAGVTVGQNTGVIANKAIALDENITMVCAKGNSTSDPCIYTESVRLYQGGATITIKAAEGCEMTTIVLHLNSKSGGQGPITVTGGTASALSNYTYTITVEAGVSEVVITTAGTDKNNRIYFDNIQVDYVK